MKKLLVTVATTLLTIAPAAAANADTTNINANQDQSYATMASKDSGNNTSLEQYSSKTVSYAALYSVKYDASETNYLKAMTSDWDNSAQSANAMNNYTTSFNTMMGGWGGQQGGGNMGGMMNGQWGQEN